MLTLSDSGVTFNDGTTIASQYTALGLGVNQTWQNVAASRALGTTYTYTNTTGMPMLLLAGISGSANALDQVILAIDGNTMGWTRTSASNGTSYVALTFTVMGLIQNGSTYSISNGNGTSVISSWWELR